MNKSYKLCIGNDITPDIAKKIDSFFNAISDIDGVIINRDILEVTYDVSKEKLIAKLMDCLLFNK